MGTQISWGQPLSGGNSPRYLEWPRFGLIFQDVKYLEIASRRFWFDWDTHGRVEKLVKENNRGVYVRYYNFYQVCPMLSNKVQVDYNYVTEKHPEWILRYKDGSPVYGAAKAAGVRLDLGNPQFVDYVIYWLKQHGFSGSEFKGHLGMDCVMYRAADPRWAKYDTAPAYHDAWEYFLRRISEAFRPQYQVVVNVGGGDLNLFARMIRWVDGVLYEGLLYPPEDPKHSDKGAQRALIMDRWEKGRWCAENGKIWAVRYRGTIDALKVESGKKLASYVSVGDREIIIFSTNQQILGKVDLTSPEADTLVKLGKALEKFGLQVTVINPFAETSSRGAFQLVNYARVDDGIILKLKQAPPEAFVFGYAAVLMVSGPNAYYILGDERHQEYYYPEMDWPVGDPKGSMQEVAPNVFRRDFQDLSALINLSDTSFQLPNGNTLPPMRGSLIRKPSN